MRAALVFGGVTALALLVLAAPASGAGARVASRRNALHGDVSVVGESVVLSHPTLGCLTFPRTSVVVRLATQEAHALRLPGEGASAAAAHLLGTTCEVKPAPCPETPCAKPWSLKLGLAASVTQGNTDSFNVVGDAAYSAHERPVDREGGARARALGVGGRPHGRADGRARARRAQLGDPVQLRLRAADVRPRRAGGLEDALDGDRGRRAPAAPHDGVGAESRRRRRPDPREANGRGRDDRPRGLPRRPLQA